MKDNSSYRGNLAGEHFSSGLDREGSRFHMTYTDAAGEFLDSGDVSSSRELAGELVVLP